MTQEIRPRLGKPPEAVGAPVPPQELIDRSIMTTAEQQLIYDDMLLKDFIEIDPKTKRPVSTSVFFKVLHVYPRYLSANPDEYRARFVIEKFEFVMDSSGVKKRQVITSFDEFADEFRINYQPTIMDSIAALHKPQTV